MGLRYEGSCKPPLLIEPKPTSVFQGNEEEATVHIVKKLMDFYLQDIFVKSLCKPIPSSDKRRQPGNSLLNNSGGELGGVRE